MTNNYNFRTGLILGPVLEFSNQMLKQVSSNHMQLVGLAD